MAGWVSGPSCSTGTGHALLGALNLLPSARGYRAQLWGLPVPQGELGRVGMVLRGDLEGVLHLPDCHHHGSLWCRVWPEAGESALHQAHSGERAGGQGQLLAGGRPHPEGMGAPGCTALTVGLICPSLEGSSLASVTAGASHGYAGGSSVWCPLPAPAPLAVPGTPQGLSGPSSLCCQGWWHVLLAQWGRVHPTVPTVCGPLLCVHVPTGRQSQRCLSGKMMLKVFGEEEIEGGRPFVCTPGPGRPVAAGSWCQGDSGANRRDNIPQSVGKSCYHSGRSQPQGLLGA